MDVKTGVGWDARVEAALTAEAFNALLGGEAACLVLRGFLERSVCLNIARRFAEAKPPAVRELVDENGRVLIAGWRLDAMLGSSAQGAEYFRKVSESEAGLAGLFSGLADPQKSLEAGLVRAGWRVVSACESGRPYNRCVAWAFSPGGRVIRHVDFHFDPGGLWVHRFPRQLNWNVYLQPAQGGGELVVYRRRDGIGPGFQRRDYADVPAASEAFLFSPQPGDCVIFDAACVHEVRPIAGERLRIQIQGMISLDPAQKVAAFWV